MLNLEETYPAKFFAKRESLLWRGYVLCPIIMNRLHPASIIDVGCGIGDFVKWFLDNRISAWGLEGSTQVIRHLVMPVERIFFADLRKIIQHFKYYDLAMSIEVAEHIEPEFADNFVENMCSFSDHILITAAGPGQGGHGHVNCQEHEYWAEKFAVKGYIPHFEIENQIIDDLSQSFTRKHRWIQAIKKNLMYFEKE